MRTLMTSSHLFLSQQTQFDDGTNIHLTMTDPNMQEDVCNNYLAMVPRGLQQPISASLSDMLEPEMRLDYLGEEESHHILEQTLEKLAGKNDKMSHHKKNKITHDWRQCPAGTVPLHNKFHASLGYTPDGKSSWTCPGQVSGSVWLSVQTKQMITSRCIGPLLAAIHHGKQSSTDTQQTLSQLVSEIGAWTTTTDSTEINTSYRHSFDNALRLWKSHACKVWKDQISKEEYRDLTLRIETDQLRFRVSCIRENSELPYTRCELLQSLMEHYGNTLIPCHSNWKVNMTRFDVEVVLVVLANGTVALGIALQPYSFHKSKSFAIGGVPPDVTPPYIGGAILSDVVRLRPTTAHLMLELAGVKPHELLVDPCAGIGTIPVEAESYFPFRMVGIGGDIVLDHDSMASATFSMEAIAKHNNNTEDATNFSRLSVAWDAALLPLRTGIVDAVVSDLPFGKLCLSSSTLNRLLPLIMVECARILVPSTGRMLLLCASPNALFRALEEFPHFWKRPCTMVAPVNIGGMLAWMVRIERSEVAFDNSSSETSTKATIGRIRAMAKKRDMRRQHASKKRKIQSKS